MQLKRTVNQLMVLISNLFMSSPHCPWGALQRQCSSLCADSKGMQHLTTLGFAADHGSGFQTSSLPLWCNIQWTETPLFFWSKRTRGSILSTLSCLVHRTSVVEPVPVCLSCNCTDFSYFSHFISPLAPWGISLSAGHFISLSLCSKQEFNVSWSTVSVCNKVSREHDFWNPSN